MSDRFEKMRRKELLRDFEKAWPRDTSDTWGVSLSYEEILTWFGSLWFIADEGSYSGDIFAVLNRCKTYEGSKGEVKQKREWGLAIIGYGSCSGCDALESARDDGREKTWELVQELYDGVEWFDSLAAVADRIDERIDKLEWWTDMCEPRQLRAVIRAFLSVPARTR